MLISRVSDEAYLAIKSLLNVTTLETTRIQIDMVALTCTPVNQEVAVETNELWGVTAYCKLRWFVLKW